MRGDRRLRILLAIALLSACRTPPPPPPPVPVPVPVAPAAPVRRPFDRAWFEPGLDLDAYTEVDLAPVDTGRRDRSAGRDAARVGERARALEAAFTKAVRTYPGGHRLSPVEAPGPETLVLELALLASGGGVALEGRARDGATGRVVARFADQEPGASPGGEDGVEVWAAQLAEILQSGGGELVEERGAFELHAWPDARR